MKTNIGTARRRLEMQGFVGLSDEEIRQFNYWLRLSPALCLIWVATGVYLGSPILLAVLVPFAFLGGMTDGHPFDAIYNHGIRHWIGRAELPDYGPPRQFACLMASVMISSTALLFAFGYSTAGYALGGLMIVVASVQVATGFCMPSKIYGLLFGPVVYKIEQGKGV
jgi:hypothetical protein